MAFAWFTDASGTTEVIHIPQTVQASGAAAAIAWVQAEKAKRFDSPGEGRAEQKPRKR